MDKTNYDIIRGIHQKHPEYLIKDLTKIIDLYNQEILTSLNKGDSVKIGKLLKLNPVYLVPRSHYDGIHHKIIKLSKRKVIKVKLLKKLKNIK